MVREGTIPVVYVAMCADLLHHGHLNVLETAATYGEVTVGVLTDKAIATYKQPPMLPFDERMRIVRALSVVDVVVGQHTLDYTTNVVELKPAYVVHGGPVQEQVRSKLIAALDSYGGKLLEIPYTDGISSTQLRDGVNAHGVTPAHRAAKLRRLINLKPMVRVMEAHNGLSGRIADTLRYDTGSEIREFDALWESSFTDSASKGQPDTEVVDFTSRVQTINQILEVTTKPLIVDGDTGGQVDHCCSMVRTLERLGVSAVIIEDKECPKRNSLLDGAVHKQATIRDFCIKMWESKRAQVTKEFMVVARIESLITGAGMEDALNRAFEYGEAGADAIMIHSKKDTPDEVLEFCKRYRWGLPIVVVPTTYAKVTEGELIEAGVSMVIYANQLLRASYRAMKYVAGAILRGERAADAHGHCAPLEDIFKAVQP